MQKLFDCVLDRTVTQIYEVDSISEVLSFYSDAASPMLWVCDTHTQHYLPPHVLSVVLLPGEEAKNWESVMSIIGKARHHSLARDGRFIALGGGVVCDVTAFAASIYMRGCAVTLIPTTVLAMVDASLGGKTGIDVFEAKNFIGTFYPASELFLCSPVLATLPESEFRNGLGEVIKHALLSQDAKLYDFLSDNRELILARDVSTLKIMIELSLQVKNLYIEQDPKERKGIRDALNLGHTFAHALESLGHMQRWTHGEAVAWGVIKALEAGIMMGITPTGFADRYRALFVSYGFEADISVTDFSAYIAALEDDKKKRKGQVRFILMKEQGIHIFAALPKETIKEVIS